LVSDESPERRSDDERHDGAGQPADVAGNPCPVARIAVGQTAAEIGTTNDDMTSRESHNALRRGQ
jgi:hypothetical protein